MLGALEGLLVVSVEQAVAAPYCSARLADAGARVLKIERPEGDFARDYDGYVHGQSSYFVWLNRGKQSVTLDFKHKDDLALLHRMIARADVLIQNLAPGAAERAGFGSAAMRAAHPRLVTVDISGYGDHGPDKVPVLISIQNDREFERLCHGVLDRPGLEKDPDYATNKARNARRDDTNAIVQKSFGAQSFADLAARLDAAQIAWARVSSVGDLAVHPQLRRIGFGTEKGEVSMPALAASYGGE